MDKEKKEPFRIDLSEIQPEELPQEDITVTLKSEKKIKVSIHPINGRGLIAWTGNPNHTIDRVTFEDKAIQLALIYGCDMTEEDSDLFMRAEPNAARTIGNAVWLLNKRFSDAKNTERENAEKNSDAAGTVSVDSAVSAGKQEI